MLVLLIVVAVVIVGAVAVVAMGRGGEMAKFPADVRPLEAEIVTAADVAMLRPPAAMWGYDKRATDEALNAVAHQVTQRDVEIAALRQRLADLQPPAPRQDTPAAPPEAGLAPGAPAGWAGAPRQDSQSWSPWQRSPAQPPQGGQQAQHGQRSPGENG